MKLSVDEVKNGNRYLNEPFAHGKGGIYLYQPNAQVLSFTSPGGVQIEIDIDFETYGADDYFLENEGHALFIHLDGVLLTEVRDTEEIEDAKLRGLVEGALRTYIEVGTRRANRNYGYLAEKDPLVRQKLIERL
jgi:hypothetical protein